MLKKNQPGRIPNKSNNNNKNNDSNLSNLVFKIMVVLTILKHMSSSLGRIIPYIMEK